MRFARASALTALLLIASPLACERAPESGAATSQSASSRLKDAAKALKEEAKDTARTIKDGAVEIGAQVQQAAHEATQQAGDAAATLKEQASKAWATTREEALDLSAKALDASRETLAALREKAAHASESTRPLIEKAAEELEKQSKSIGEKYEQLKTAAPEQWQKNSEQLGPQLEQLKSAAAAAARQFGVSGAAERAAKITGTVGYRDKSAIPSGCELTLRLLDASKADAAPIVIVEKTSPIQGQPPLPFELAYESAKINESGAYSLDATITLSGKVLRRGTTPVLTRGNPSKVDIVVNGAGE